MSKKCISATLFTATLSLLTACGGETKTTSANNENTPHPEFTWAKVSVSNAYKPSGNSKDTTPTFKWKSVTNASRYQFGHEDIDSGMRWRDYTLSANQAGCKTGSSCSYTPKDITFAIGDHKAWWVRANVGGQWKNWSNPYTFKIVGNGTKNPINAKPISPKGTINTLKPTFKWTPGNGATRYQLGYENSNGTGWKQHTLTASQANCQSSQCSYKPNSIEPVLSTNPGKTWWIRSYINGSWKAWSHGLNFKTQSYPTDRQERMRFAKNLIHIAGTATTEDIPSVRWELSKLPISVLRKFNQWGTKVMVVRGSITEYYPNLKGVTPRGWPAGLTWDSVPGVSDSDKNQIVIATRLINGKRQVPPKGNGHGSYNLVLHEIAHNYNSHAGNTKESKFIAARNAVIKAGRLTDAYHLQAGAAGPSETFAESFAVYFGGVGKQAFKYTEIYNYIQNNIAHSIAPKFKTIEQQPIAKPDGKPYIWGISEDGLEL